MDLKRLITHFTYQIEAKPEGGFIAHASDPTLEPLEAPTRMELQQKIQQNISAALANEFPGLKLPIQSQQLKMTFHVEQKAGGGFTLHSSDPNSQPAEAASHEIESKFAEKLVGMMGKHFMSQLPPELAGQLSSGGIKVFVSRTGMPGPNAASLTSGDAQGVVLSNTEPAMSSGGSVTYSGDNSPIKPANNSSWVIFRFLLTLLIIAAIMYFYLHYR